MSLGFRFFHEQAEKETEAERNPVETKAHRKLYFYYFLSYFLTIRHSPLKSSPKRSKILCSFSSVVSRQIVFIDTPS